VLGSTRGGARIKFVNRSFFLELNVLWGRRTVTTLLLQASLSKGRCRQRYIPIHVFDVYTNIAFRSQEFLVGILVIGKLGGRGLVLVIVSLIGPLEALGALPHFNSVASKSFSGGPCPCERGFECSMAVVLLMVVR